MQKIQQQIYRALLFIEKYKIQASIIFGAVIISTALFYSFFIKAPSNFPTRTIFTVNEGAGVSSVAKKLSDAHIIKSKFLFTNMVIVLGHEDGILAGDYFFEKPIGLLNVVWHLSRGDYGFTPEKITIPEGFTKNQIADLLATKLQNFDKEKFLEISKEGYLFPDTYLFPPNMTAENVEKAMRKNFDSKIKDLQQDIENSGKTLDEIINMASILEEEARTTETRQIISGILWKRIEIGMALQVDVTFQYVNGKNTYELSQKDLEIDSPYNTYKYAGLPPTPISNPGLDAIKAAISPKITPYLYFLSSRNGTMYYARDFEEHKKNRTLYLN